MGLVVSPRFASASDGALIFFLRLNDPENSAHRFNSGDFRVPMLA